MATLPSDVEDFSAGAIRMLEGINRNRSRALRRQHMAQTRHLGIWAVAIGLSAMLIACGDGKITISVNPIPSYSFDRPPPSNVCPDGTIVWNIHDCQFSLSNP
jgi:hypothetical protein